MAEAQRAAAEAQQAAGSTRDAQAAAASLQEQVAGMQRQLQVRASCNLQPASCSSACLPDASLIVCGRCDHCRIVIAKAFTAYSADCNLLIHACWLHHEGGLQLPDEVAPSAESQRCSACRNNRCEHVQVMNEEAAAARQAARHAAQQLDAVQREGRDRDAALAEVLLGP